MSFFHLSLSVAPRSAEEWTADVEDRLQWGLKLAEKQSLLKPEQIVVLVTGFQAGSGHTNTVKVVRYEQPKSTTTQ